MSAQVNQINFLEQGIEPAPTPEEILHTEQQRLIHHNNNLQACIDRNNRTLRAIRLELVAIYQRKRIQAAEYVEDVK